jgi:hypothetical protein
VSIRGVDKLVIGRTCSAPVRGVPYEPAAHALRPWCYTASRGQRRVCEAEIERVVLEVALRGSSLEEKVWRITLGTWERSEESLQELVAANRGLRTFLEVEELHTTTIRRRIPPPRRRLLYRHSEFESITIPPLAVDIYIY